MSHAGCMLSRVLLNTRADLRSVCVSQEVCVCTGLGQVACVIPKTYTYQIWDVVVMVFMIVMHNEYEADWSCCVCS